MSPFLRLAAATAIVAVAAPAHAQTDALKLLRRIQSGNAATPNAPDGQPAATGSDIAPKPIEFAAMPVTLKRHGWHDSTWQLYPSRVAIVGYNVGAFNSVLVTGKARGFLTAQSEGATSQLRLVGDGIDYALLAGIAGEAYADLAHQLAEAGFEVIPMSQVRGAPGADKLRLGSPGYEMKYAEKSVSQTGIVNGPPSVGVRGQYPINKIDFNFAAAEPSIALKSILVMPNILFDFAEGKGSRGLGSSASAKAELHFGINQDFSQWRLTSSNRPGAQAESFLNLGAPVETDAEFGSVGSTTKSDNGKARAIAGLLGASMRSESEKVVSMEIDREAYRALALAAAKGWNSAFVAELKAATGK